MNQRFLSLTYSECLWFCTSLFLKRWRLHCDLLEIFRIICGSPDGPNRGVLSECAVFATRTHDFKLLKPCVRLYILYCSFNYNVVDRWNSLPNSVVSTRSMDSFKEMLDSALGGAFPHWSQIVMKLDVGSHIGSEPHW